MAPPANRRYSLIAGIDEAGRGPLAGPVVAAAVILDPNRPIPEVRDSKTLSPAQREKLFAQIIARAMAIGVGIVDVKTIDRLNIHHATLLAMGEAFFRLSVQPTFVLVDGKFPVPSILTPQIGIPHGDSLFPAISAASIIAKVTRDRMMTNLSKLYPRYLFEKHKGYGTPEHLKALQAHGACAIHRKTFGPVRALLS